MKKLVMDDMTISYNDVGQGLPVVLLHGWGQNKEMMKPIESHVETRFRVINIDFPLFGESSDPKESWGCPEYTLWLHHFLELIDVKNPVIIAHSFGARIAIRYASEYPTAKLVLTGAAGIAPHRSLAVKARTGIFKTAKSILATVGLSSITDKVKEKIGSEDYVEAKGIKRNILVNVVNDDIRHLLSKISCPCLLIWGENDDATPLWMGKIMEAEIPDAGLVVFPKEGHFAYYNQIHRFNTILDSFL